MRGDSVSADNWSLCPKCKSEADEKHRKQILSAGEAYGKVEPEEYLRLIVSAEVEINHENTLREDYELGVDEDGYFTVVYRCSCQCGFSYMYRHEETAWRPPEARP